MVQLHGSSARGGPGSDHGDYYLFWGHREWGYCDGLPWQFTVDERVVPNTRGRRLSLYSRETMAHPNGNGTRETYWFGYYCRPQWANHEGPRAYNFTERRTQWLIDWVKNGYHVDPDRVYAEGGSMGAWGTAGFALRHPELFAAIYPNRPRMKQRGLPSLVKVARDAPILMDDGKTDYYKRMNMVRFVSDHHDDLPFIGWCCGRHDGFATFKEQIEMVRALTASRHGFAFAWNDGDHSSGAASMREIKRWYPPEKFARNQSYPAFGNCSIDDDLGTGEVEVRDGGRVRQIVKNDNGDREGGINLGFVWKVVADESAKWSITISNDLAKGEMTVDVTPRRCQQFKPRNGETVSWNNTAGGSGTVTVDKWGLVTVPDVRISAGKETVLTFEK
jgi:pimeloyl-ACP methyl ester carboxylesterase